MILSTSPRVLPVNQRNQYTASMSLGTSDTAAALNPKDEKSLFEIKSAGYIGRAFELLSDNGRPTTATNAYDLLTSRAERQNTLDKLTKLDTMSRRVRLAEIFEKTYLNHEEKEQRAGEIGTSQNYLEYLGTPRSQRF